MNPLVKNWYTTNLVSFHGPYTSAIPTEVYYSLAHWIGIDFLLISIGIWFLRKK